MTFFFLIIIIVTSVNSCNEPFVSECQNLETLKFWKIPKSID